MFYIIAEKEKISGIEELGLHVGHLSFGARWKI
jgi:hypothetical protein